MLKDFANGGVGSSFIRLAPSLGSELVSLKNPNSGIVPALDILQDAYNEMKEHLDAGGPSTGLLPATTIVDEIKAGIEKIEHAFSMGIFRKTAKKKNIEYVSDSDDAIDDDNDNDDIDEDDDDDDDDLSLNCDKSLNDDDVNDNVGIRRSNLKHKGYENKSSNSLSRPGPSNETADNGENEKYTVRVRKKEVLNRTVQSQFVIVEYVFGCGCILNKNN